MGVKKITTVRNPQGFEVKKCCASCLFKMVNHKSVRICTKKNVRVKQYSKCKKWKMSDKLIMAGYKSDGVVRDKDTKEVVIF